MLKGFAYILIFAALAVSARSSDVPRPDLAVEIAGQYIVVFRQGSGSAVAAAAALSTHVRSKLAAAGDVQAASLSSLQVLHTLGDYTAPLPPSGSVTHPEAAVAAAATAAAADRLSDATAASESVTTGIQGVVMRIERPAALAAVRAASNVQAVVPDRPIAAQQEPTYNTTCILPQQLSKGLTPSFVPKGFVWRGCRKSTTELRWIGERCGPNMDQIRYTAVYAVHKDTGMLAKVNGTDCVMTLNLTDHPTYTRVRFGYCGVPPRFGLSLPTCLKSTAAPLEYSSSGSSNSGSANSSTGSSSDSSSQAGCLPMPETSTGMVWFNKTVTLSAMVRCGSNDFNKWTYRGMACGPNAEFVLWHHAVTDSGCRLILRGNKVKENNDMFGSCGIPPGIMPAEGPALATNVCPQAVPDPSPSPEPQSPSPSPEPQSPSPSPVLEPQPSPSTPVDTPSPSPSPSPVLVESPAPVPSPVLPSPSPSSPSPSPQPQRFNPMPRTSVVSGEEVPAGIQRIEAATTSGVVDVRRVPANRYMAVGVLDSGIDGTHPDLNYVGGLSWVRATTDRPDDDRANVDALGHGTHLAGTVGAKNAGTGVVGVSPGVPLFSLKVLDGDGNGALSTVISAMKWVVATGVKQGIRVVNISLAAFVNPTSPDYEATVDLVCGIFQQASDAGVIVVVAAGNLGSPVDGYLPTSCPTVAVVTALDADMTSVAAFSNYMSASTPADDLARVFAAPGTNVASTVSYRVDTGGYAYMSGTSMAAPHVAGVAANCIMSGACTASSGSGNLAVLQAAAQQRYNVTTAKPYGFSGDPTSTQQDRYYGYMVWAGAF